MTTTRVTVKHLIKTLKLALKEFGDLPVVTSSDDEGNSFNVVYYDPSMMEHVEVTNSSNGYEKIKKAICIN